ncbi:Uncharacterized conserved protein YqhQ [Tissierella praeacuta DSM 18095]|uniref:Uncharacterized conserved protein YqhQ n=1 Tax=Tissierella praeacuta DSM 18095 TaxID=1123404 RepID=A0A1M4WI44_9FIRM|nr:DUF1385 domain-containing protein [Tissierella praeacuta]SHE80971.1 Uncharacterized conserved protein YqhQ [Tissierella praeacuta DSM 18095]SUO99402.1 Predicted metal-dependent enzyme [Tissierella praeacuta]
MKIKNLDRTPKHITSIGGQALIEGVMMRGPKDIAIAVRKPNKEIEIKKERLNTLGMKYKIFQLPFLRGVVGLIEALMFGTRALMYSAEFFEDEEDSGKESLTEKLFKDKAEEAEMAFAVISSVVLAIGMFMILPTILTNFFKDKISSPIGLNLVEGLVRIIIFLIYIIGVSKFEDIKRVFEYHGAEHKTIHCYENEEELTVENVKKYPILHPRCGTSFLFMVMIISILVLSFFGWPNPLQRFIIRILMFPVIAGISYEINKLIGKSNSRLAYFLSYPGLMIQKLATVKEPDGEQIQVAIESLKAVLTDNKDEDKW